MRLLKRTLATLLLPALAGILLLTATPAQAMDKDQDNSKSVTVMTWNLYFGFDDGPVVAAALSGDPEAVVAAATEAWRQVHATDFHRRVRDIALQVRLHAPDFIGVQEAARYVQIANMGELPDATIDAFLGAVAAVVGEARRAGPAIVRPALKSV